MADLKFPSISHGFAVLRRAPETQRKLLESIRISDSILKAYCDENELGLDLFHQVWGALLFPVSHGFSALAPPFQLGSRGASLLTSVTSGRSACDAHGESGRHITCRR